MSYWSNQKNPDLISSLRNKMLIGFSVILHSMYMLVEGSKRHCKKDVPSSRGMACSKALGKEAAQYILRTDGTTR